MFILLILKVGRTPLQIAATGGHVEVVRVLLKNGANPNSRDKLVYNKYIHFMFLVIIYIYFFYNNNK